MGNCIFFSNYNNYTLNARAPPPHLYCMATWMSAPCRRGRPLEVTSSRVAVNAWHMQLGQLVTRQREEDANFVLPASVAVSGKAGTQGCKALTAYYITLSMQARKVFFCNHSQMNSFLMAPWVCQGLKTGLVLCSRQSMQAVAARCQKACCCFLCHQVPHRN